VAKKQLIVFNSLRDLFLVLIDPYVKIALMTKTVFALILEESLLPAISPIPLKFTAKPAPHAQVVSAKMAPSLPAKNQRKAQLINPLVPKLLLSVAMLTLETPNVFALKPVYQANATVLRNNKLAKPYPLAQQFLLDLLAICMKLL
jgi:hypothetical protein